MRPEGPKKILLETALPLSQGLDDRVLPPYLRVWMTVSPPLSQGLNDRVPPLISGSGWPCPPLISGSGWPCPPPLISGSGWPCPPPPYLRVWIHHCAVKREDKRSVRFDQQLRTFTHLFSNVFLTYLNASLTGIYLQTFEFVCPNLSLPVPINQVIVMEISLLALWLGLIAVKFS